VGLPVVQINGGSMIEWDILEWFLGKEIVGPPGDTLKVGAGRLQGYFLGEGFRKDYVELGVIYILWVDAGSG